MVELMVSHATDHLTRLITHRNPGWACCVVPPSVMPMMLIHCVNCLLSETVTHGLSSFLVIMLPDSIDPDSIVSRTPFSVIQCLAMVWCHKEWAIRMLSGQLCSCFVLGKRRGGQGYNKSRKAGSEFLTINSFANPHSYNYYQNHLRLIYSSLLSY